MILVNSVKYVKQQEQRSNVVETRKPSMENFQSYYNNTNFVNYKNAKYTQQKLTNP